ncbi:MAG TPA: ABC transporter ATP-binding protein [Anaerolineales bacterium]|nr:ABC transporter ATP-binding protein [Anaerolineales bacterium]
MREATFSGDRVPFPSLQGVGPGQDRRLELHHVSMAFHADGRPFQALEDVSFSVAPREFVALVGPSGSGKSTLFNLIVGLLQPTRGEIVLDGEVCPDRLGRFGYMPQRDLLLPWRDILGNVTTPLELRGVPLDGARRRALELFPLFGLEGFERSYPAALSGGMRQRAALLRTVLIDSSTLLLDEPFGALDALTRREMQDWLLGLWSRLQPTVLFITHDVDEAVYLADRVLVFSARPGRLIDEVVITLPRPRRQSMVTLPAFGAHVASLLDALGVNAPSSDPSSDEGGLRTGAGPAE